ncbi:MAG: glycosyltransferase [Candidatus Delongbacteria bacterium]|jgi:GT2 family glycosyltransferase|nr:glycosyltransferase [Candidatus Delongbacteria bacterium]MDD4204774.1 glycosyltransferase [Candidatus Delongbacteria bacterium]MDY0017677.1 glycosyltransferase [Candidatus Delongbacteria bacterium]
MDLSVVIVNYNVKYFLENTVRSLIDTVKDLSYEIIIVDNASRDGSKEHITSKFPDLNYIYNESNLGFAKANNQGLKIAKGDYVLILNPDTIVKENSVNLLINYLRKNEKTGLVTCKIIGPEGTLDASCHRSFPTIWNSFCHLSGLSKLFPNSKIFASYNLLYLEDDRIAEVDAVSGSFMLLRKSIIDEGILMPEDYFMYGEDIDFCYQIKRRGYKIEYVPISEIVHYRGQSSKKDKIKLRKYFFDSMKIFVKKNYTSKYSLFFKFILDMAIMFSFIISIGKIIFRMYLLPIIDIISYVIGLWAALLFYRPVLVLMGKISPGSRTDISFDMYVFVSLIYIVILLIIFYFSKLYGEFKFSFRKFFFSVSYFVLLSMSITYFMKIFAYSRIVLALMLTISTGMMFVWRFLLLRRIKLFLDKTLIVGIDDVSSSVIEYENMLAKEGKNIIGFVDIGESYLGKSIGKYAVLGSIDNLKEIIKIEQVNSVIFSLNSISLSKILVYRDMLEYNKVTYRILPDFINTQGGMINYINISQ